jgi:hypothetical protein
VHGRVKRFEAAGRDLLEGLEADPTHPSARRIASWVARGLAREGWHHHTEGKRDDALRCLDLAAVLAPGDAEIGGWRARAVEAGGEDLAALEAASSEAPDKASDAARRERIGERVDAIERVRASIVGILRVHARVLRMQVEVLLMGSSARAKESSSGGPDSPREARLALVPHCVDDNAVLPLVDLVEADVAGLPSRDDELTQPVLDRPAEERMLLEWRERRADQRTESLP